MSSEQIESVSVKQEKPDVLDSPSIKTEPEAGTKVKKETDNAQDKSITDDGDSESSPPKKVKIEKEEESGDKDAEQPEVSAKIEEPKSEDNQPAESSVKVETGSTAAGRFKPMWTVRPRREYPVLKGPPLEPQHVTSLATLGPFLAKHDNWRNYDYITPIPQICKDEPCMLGIDEAGRGPVLGPMVYGIAFCPLSQAKHLKTLGCADSKQLSETDRERIFDDLNRCDYAHSNIGWAIDVISPSYISEKMLSRVKVSLNEISMLSAIGLVQKAIDAGVNIAEVYVDTVGPPEKYQARLAALWPDFQITVAKKADSTYPIVSAASICAKVSRDHALRVWKFPEGIKATYEDFGSGYPGDPKTKAFLEDNVDRVFGFPRIVRFSWSTAAEVLKRKAIPMVFPDTEEEKEQKARKARSIKNFMQPADPDAYEPCQFFKDRYLSHCYEI